jgi:L-asparagine transporter-like permease
VVAISMSAMLGSGIFVLPGLAAAQTGPSVWLAYVLAGICAFPAAACKARIAALTLKTDLLQRLRGAQDDESMRAALTECSAEITG